MVSKDDAKKEVSRLIGKYDNVTISGNKYNEEMTKKDFILPLFRALGWDVEDSNEVTAEESLLKGAVDYAFLINKNYKFFVEAKPLGSDLRKYAQQAITYGVNSSSTWVVLTNFESIIVFNCEWQEKDWWKNTLFEQLGYKDYLEQFDLLWLLSKEGIINDTLEKYAASKGKRVPRMPIDKELLSKLLQYRMKLSKEISKISKYNETEIDELVQRLLIRLLFIRNCEDRGFETKYKLLSIVEGFKTHKRGLSKFLRAVFDHYNNRYNGSIFKEAEIDKIRFDEKLLAEIIEGFYYTVDRLKYNFNIIPADVMGSLYEQYLGHILKKTPQSAKLKEGKTHRKEQGIYYTPTYIVDYIVRNTLGKILKGKKVDASKIRILDPACGSGSFLVKAFDVLNEHYAKDKESYGQKTLAGNDITYSAKERILKNNIFGVDLDKQAAEIARLNLLLRIAAQEQKLPLLEQNIRIGNSLIDDEKVAGDKAFKWEEQFKDIIQFDKDGNLKKEYGFDVVIGNPPYINMQTLPELQKWCELRYPEIYTGQNDILYYFILRGLKILKNGGKLGFIISRYFLESLYASKFRKFILENSAIDTIIDFNNFQVFGRDVNVLTSIIILKREDELKRKRNIIKVIKIKKWDKFGSELMAHILQNKDIKVYSDDSIDIFPIDQKDLSSSSWILSSPVIQKIKVKLENGSMPLNKYVRIGQGIKAGLNKVFIVDEETINKNKLEHSLLRKYIKTKDIKKYRLMNRGLYLIRITKGEDIEKYPNLKKYLSLYRRELKERYQYKDKVCEWYSLSLPQNIDLFDNSKEKLITPLYSTSNKFVYDSDCLYTLTDTYVLALKSNLNINLKYILGLLNSKVIEFYFKNTAKLKREGYYEYSGGSLSKIPIKHDEKSEKIILPLVDRMLSLNKRLNEIGDKKTDERAKTEEEIKKTNTEIDELVCKIYGITEEEKKIIEESLK